MRRIKPESLKALNLKLDIVRVLEEMGVADIADTHPEVLSSCPFHSGSGVEAVLTVDKKSRTAICDEAQCVVASGEPLLEVYARAMKKPLDESAAYWAGIFDAALDYEELPEPAAVAVAVSTPSATVMAVHDELSPGELEADDLAGISGDHAQLMEDILGDTGPVEEAAEPVALVPEEGIGAAPVAPQSTIPSPASTMKLAVGDSLHAPVRAEREADEQALIGYLLGDDSAALAEVAAHGVTEVDLQGGGAGPAGLSLHGTLLLAVRRARARRTTGDPLAVLDHVDHAIREAAARQLEAIRKAPPADRQRFRQALRRISESILRDNLESALRASITDIVTHPEEDSHALMRHALERIQSVGRRGVGPLVAQEAAIPDLLDGIFDARQVPIPTFADGLNKLLNGGLQFGQLCVLTGAAGSGKTAFLLQMADGIAASNAERVKKGLPLMPVVYVSTSVSRRDLTIRSLSRFSKMNAGALLSKRWISGWEGNFLESEIDINEEVESVSAYYERRVREAENAYKVVEPYLAIVEGMPSISVEAIRSCCLQALRRFGCGSVALIVDVLDHVTLSDEPVAHHAEAEEARLDLVAASLKHMAVSMGLPVIASLDAPASGRNPSEPRAAARIPARLQGMADTALALNVDEDILQAGNVKHAPNLLSKRQHAFKEMLDRIREDYPLEFSHSEYAVLDPLKHRSGGLEPVVFIFNKAWHSFEEMEL